MHHMHKESGGKMVTDTPVHSYLKDTVTVLRISLVAITGIIAAYLLGGHTKWFLEGKVTFYFLIWEREL